MSNSLVRAYDDNYVMVAQIITDDVTKAIETLHSIYPDCVIKSVRMKEDDQKRE